AVEDQIRRVGYKPVPFSDEDSRLPAPHGQDEAALERPWWRTRKGGLAIGIGSLLALAFVIAQLAPDIAMWAYIAAAAVGIVPFARRAITGALTGTPFSIETLMSVAAAGAIAIGEAEEAAVVVFLFAVG